MKNPISIPVLRKVDTDDSIGSPATIIETIKTESHEALSKLIIDENTLGQCLEAVKGILQFVNEKLDETSSIKTDSIAIQLGVTATGKVGFLGTGLDVELATTIELTLKVN